jgi:hypothetical protein
MRPGKRHALPQNPMGRILEELEQLKASVRAQAPATASAVHRGRVTQTAPLTGLPSCGRFGRHTGIIVFGLVGLTSA